MKKNQQQQQHTKKKNSPKKQKFSPWYPSSSQQSDVHFVSALAQNTSRLPTVCECLVNQRRRVAMKFCCRRCGRWVMEYLVYHSFLSLSPRRLESYIMYAKEGAHRETT